MFLLSISFYLTVCPFCTGWSVSVPLELTFTLPHSTLCPQRLTPMDCTTSFPCPSGFFLILWQMEGPARDKKMRWGSLISWILSSQATEGSGCLPLSDITVPAEWFLSIATGWPKFWQQLSLLVISGPSLLTFHWCYSRGVLLYYIGSLNAGHTFEESLHSTLQLASLGVPPAPCQEPCGATWFPWEHPLLVLLEPFCSFLCLPLRCWCPRILPRFLSSSFNRSPYLTSLTCRSMSIDPSFKISQPTSISYKINN